MNVIDAIPHRLREKFLFTALAPIQALLPAAVIEGFCREAGYAWRERKWGPAISKATSLGMAEHPDQTDRRADEPLHCAIGLDPPAPARYCLTHAKHIFIRFG